MFRCATKACMAYFSKRNFDNILVDRKRSIEKEKKTAFLHY